jgi:RNA polymerase sigma-70 factor (ECF subfamily)
MSNRTPGHAQLLEQVSWIRRLARELVHDRELAEDLVQETCVVALERSPREPARLRQWLAEVLRNVLRQRARAANRRKQREADAARAEALEPTDQLVERALLQRALVDAVLELEEPYRSTVLLRFFEELPPREIARRSGVPLATVMSRIQRALARLRGRLDSEHRAWSAVLLPWSMAKEVLGPPAALAVLMNTKLVVSVVAGVAASAVLYWNLSRGGPARAPVASASLPTRDETVLESFRASHGAASEDRRESSLLAPRPLLPTTSTPTPPDALAWQVRLRVLDAEGLPLPNIAVRSEDSEEVQATSGAGGWCSLEAHGEREVFLAADARWVTIHAGSPVRGSPVDPVLVVAPAIELAGFVVDSAGRPIGGASLRFDLPSGFRARFTEILEATRTVGWRATSESDGAFRLERVPAVPKAILAAVRDGYERAWMEAPESSARGLELVLRWPESPQAGTLRGRVIEPSGVPVPAARVGLGLTSVLSDEQGLFELALARAVTTDVLTAVKAGHRPARLERPSEPSPTSAGWPDEVTLVLPGPSLSIRGVVLDAHGMPVSGARLWLHDPTPGAPIGQMPTFLEPQMAGAPVPPAALESTAQLPESDGDHFYDHYTNDQQPSAMWNWVVTDASGRFELPGLDERRYRLDVMPPDALTITTTPALFAGDTSAVIRLEAPDLHESVAGQVLSNGRGVPGVEARLFRPLVDIRARIFGGHSQVVILKDAGSVLTDSEGRFHFERVPKSGAQISVRGGAIVPTSVPVDSAALEIPVDVRCHLEVVVSLAPERFDSIEVADDEGERLDIMVLTEGSVNAWSSVELVDGRSGVVSVSSRARALRLRRGETVVETRPLALVPGAINRVEL